MGIPLGECAYRRIKLSGKAPTFGLNGELYMFFNENDVSKVSYVRDWISNSKANNKYKNDNGKAFGKMIMGLDLLEFVTEKRKSASSQTITKRSDNSSSMISHAV